MSMNGKSCLIPILTEYTGQVIKAKHINVKTQEALAPSRHYYKFDDYEIKPKFIQTNYENYQKGRVILHPVCCNVSKQISLLGRSPRFSRALGIKPTLMNGKSCLNPILREYTGQVIKAEHVNSQEYWLKPRKRWLRPDMIEKLMTDIKPKFKQKSSYRNYQQRNILLQSF